MDMHLATVYRTLETLEDGMEGVPEVARGHGHNGEQVETLEAVGWIL